MVAERVAAGRCRRAEAKETVGPAHRRPGRLEERTGAGGVTKLIFFPFAVDEGPL